jgi:hypothetical protein
MRMSRTRPRVARLGAALAVAAAVLAAVAAPAAAGAAPRMAPPGALVLVDRLTLDEALAATGADGQRVTGFVSTLPPDQPFAARVLSLAAGRRVDADALGAAGGASPLPDPAAVQRLRADNPDARFGRLPPTRVLAWPGMEAAGLFALGPAGPAPAAGRLEPDGQPVPRRPGELLVVAVPDAAALARVLPRLAGGAGGILVVGLRPAPGRAGAAPLLLDAERGGLPTSDSTRRQGLVALEDLRPTLAGSSSEGDDGAPVRVAEVGDPAAVAVRLDRRAGALVVARTWAIPLLALAASLALLALLAAWRAPGGPAGGSGGGVRPEGSGEPRRGAPVNRAQRGPPGRSAGAERAGRAARALLAITLALPSGYLAASMAEPAAARAWQALDAGAFRAAGSTGPWAAAWVGAGLAAAVLLALVALRLDRPSAPAAGGGAGPDPAARPARTVEGAGPDPAARTVEGAGPDPAARPSALRLPAPLLLGGVLLVLVAIDLLRGGDGLAQPLLGGSAWDGERFYGLGNGYFAFALAAAMLVICFAPLRAAPAATLLAALAVLDGLPRLGADVGGSLTAMLTAAAALVLLAPGRPRAGRLAGLAAVAVAAALAVALGAGLGGPETHAGRFADRLLQGPGDAVGVVVDQLTRNLRLLHNSPFAWVGPLQVLAAALIALRPPAPLAGIGDWVRRVLGLGALGSALLIVLNDTGVTATAASGMFLLAIPAWASLDPTGRAGGPTPPAPARPAVGVHPPGRSAHPPV